MYSLIVIDVFSFWRCAHIHLAWYARVSKVYVGILLHQTLDLWLCCQCTLLVSDFGIQPLSFGLWWSDWGVMWIINKDHQRGNKGTFLCFEHDVITDSRYCDVILFLLLLFIDVTFSRDLSWWEIFSVLFLNLVKPCLLITVKTHAHA